MLPYRDSTFAKIALGVFFVIAASYAYFEARGLLYGPSISVPSEIIVLHDPFATISGKADRISSLTMNGKPISVTEDGAFEEPYLLAPGYNRIALHATDKYGRTRDSVVEIMYEPPSTTSAVAATTSIEITPQ